MSKYLSHSVTITDDGEWIHGGGSDFIFAYLDNDMDSDLKNAVSDAFKSSLHIPGEIKEAVKNTSGDAVVNGLYILNQEAMTKAMNSIDGMSETEANQVTKEGQGTAVSINKEFFSAILAGVSGEVLPIMDYLTGAMGDLKAEAGKSEIKKNFGTIIGLISVMPVLDIPVTTFHYAYADSNTGKWFVKLDCADVEKTSYKYSFTDVSYLYDAPS